MEENLWKISLFGYPKHGGIDVLCPKLLIGTKKKDQTNKRNYVFLTLYFHFCNIHV